MKPLLLLLISSIGLSSYAQDSTVQLNFNNVNATITNKGHFFNDDVNNLPGYEIPKGTGLTTIYTSSPWYAAVNDSGEIFMCAGGYGQGYDIDRGPYSSTNAYSDPSYDNSYMFSICQSDIDQFKLWWECANGLSIPGCEEVNQPSFDVLNTIYGWPAHGDLSLGQEFYLAPFYDRNGDGVYDPIGQGDYPIIKGCCATYLIQNDVGKLHTYTGTDPIGIEMHYLIYQYGANNLLYNTTFVDVMAINKGGTNYPSFSQGFYVDADLGNYSDDYFGSDSVNNMMFFYNGDNLDEPFGGQLGYDQNPPAFGIVALENPLTSAVLYSSSGSSVASINYQLNGLQFDSSPWVDPNGITTRFPYSGNPNDPTQWSEVSIANPTSDRRAVMSTTYNQFNAGDTVKQTYAIIYSRIGNNLENAEHLSVLAQEVQAFYDGGDTDCDAGGFVGLPEMESANIRIYPNPNNGEFTVESPDEQIKSIRLFNVAGNEKSLTKQNTGSSVIVNVEDYATGVYLLYIESENEHRIERIILE